MKHKRPTNILQHLTLRERNLSFGLRRRFQYLSYVNYHIIRKLILDPNSSFKILKRITSRTSGIHYEQQRIFTDSYTKSQPSTTPRQNSRGCWTRSQKDAFKDGALFLLCPVNEIPTDNQGEPHYRNSLIGISKDFSTSAAKCQRLLFVDFFNGDLWHEMSLPQCLPAGVLRFYNEFGRKSRFWQELEWNKDQESFFLRSVHRMPSLCTNLEAAQAGAMAVQAGSAAAVNGAEGAESADGTNGWDLDFVVALLIMKVHPIEGVAMFEVRKSHFGANISLASVNNDSLITFHRGNLVKVFSLQTLINLNPEIVPEENEFQPHTSLFPAKNIPPVLYQVKSNDFFLEMGGFPWHALIQAEASTFPSICINSKQSPLHPDAKGKFCVIDFSSGQITGAIGNGQLLLLDPENATFRDDSGTIIFTGHDRVQTFVIRDEAAKNGEQSLQHSEEEPSDVNMALLQTKYMLTAEGRNKDLIVRPESPKQTTVTRSGRKVKSRTVLENLVDLDDVRGQFFCTGYEDDLELTFVVHVDHHRNHGSKRTKKNKAQLWLVDDENGDVLKRISLDTDWDDDDTVLANNVELDLDTIVHTVKKYNGMNECTVYVLDRGESMFDGEFRSNSKKLVKYRKIK